MADEKDYLSLLTRLYNETPSPSPGARCGPSTWRANVSCRHGERRVNDALRGEALTFKLVGDKNIEAQTAASSHFDKLYELYRDQSGPFVDMLLRSEKQNSLLEVIGSRTERLLANSEAQRREHAEIIERCERLESALTRQREENEALRLLLDGRYSAEKLSVIAGAMLFAFAVALFASLVSSATIIHPALSIVGILGSAGFLCLARWRETHAR